MRLLTALKTLQNIGVPILQTEDAACLLKLSNEHTSQLLRRLSLEKQVVHLSRGFWAIDVNINPLLIPEYLIAPFSLLCFVTDSPLSSWHDRPNPLHYLCSIAYSHTAYLYTSSHDFSAPYCS